MKPITITSASAKNYYYENDPITNQNKTGENISFQGNLAEAFDLSNSLNKEEFDNLLDGKDPKTGEELVGDGGNANKRAAIDLPFSAPKSISHVALVLEKNDVVEAHKEAVESALNYIEDNLIQVRAYNENNERIHRQTDNMIVAKVEHSTSRPVNGAAPDPSLHTHALIMNMTYDNVDDKFKAISNEEIFKNQSLINDIYKSELAKNLKEKGYELNFKENGNFEIKGYTQDILDNFSKRHNQILETKEKLNNKDFKNLGKLDEIAQHTSKSEKIDINKQDLIKDWKEQHEKNNLKSINDLEKDIKNATINNTTKIDTKEAVSLAAQNLVEKEAVFDKKELLKEALKIGRGDLGYKEIEKEIENIKKIGQKNDNDLVKLDNNKFTTKKMKEIEKENVNIVKNQKSFKNLMTEKEADKAIKSFENEKGWEMTSGQRNAVKTLLTSKEQFVAIQGDAGVGKTTLLEAFRIANEIKNTDLKAQVLAPTGKAAAEAESASGIKGNTVDSFLLKETKQQYYNAKQDFNKKDFKTISKNVTTAKNYYKIDKVEKLLKGENKGTERKSTFEVRGDLFFNKSETKLSNGNKIIFERQEWNPLKAAGLKNVNILNFSTFSKEEKVGNRFKDLLTSNKNFKEKVKDLFDNNKYSKSKAAGISINFGGLKFNHSKFKNNDGFEKKTTSFSILGLSVSTTTQTIKNKNGKILEQKVEKEKKLFNITLSKDVKVKKGKVDDKELKNILKNDKMLIIDESSMLSAKKANEILKYAKENDVRVVFMGDSKQLQSIEAGRFFNQLKENTKTVEVTESVRQRDNLEAKAVVDKVANKDILSAFKDLKQGIGGEIKEVANFKDRVNLAVDKLTKDVKNTLIVAATRLEVKEVNNVAREKIFGDKNFGKTFTIETNKNLSAFKKQTAAAYSKNDIVTFKNKEYTVKDKDTSNNTLTLKDKKNNEITIDLKKEAQNINNVKAAEKRNFAENDKIVFTKNDKKLGVFNGEIGYIKKIDESKIEIEKENGKIVNIDLNKYKNIDHAYAITVNKSQGTTSKNVVAMFNSSSGMNNYNFAYVALSRHKENVTALTDNTQKLEKQITNEQQKTSTLDYTKNDKNIDKNLKNEDIKQLQNEKNTEKNVEKSR